MFALLITVVLLLGCVALGWLAGDRLAQRAAHGTDAVGATGSGEQSHRLTDAIAFVGGAYGIVLGLLLVFAVQHFVDTRQVSREEAVTATTLFSALEPFAAEQRDPIRRDLVCYVRALASDDWAAARVADPTGSENANAYGQRLQLGIQGLPQDTTTEESNHFFATEAVLNLVADRQLRLLYANPEIPPIVWFVILVAAMIFTGLMAYHMHGNRSLARFAIGSTTLVLVVVTAALIMLDKPFVGVGAALKPVALEGALRQIQDAYPDPAYWGPCQRLAEESDDSGSPAPM